MDDKTWWYSLHLTAHPWMVRLVRDSLRTALHRHDREDLTDTACLLATELVTNGIVHTGLPITVHARWEHGRLRVNVHDNSPVLPTQCEAADGDEGGRGLLLVRSCAASWGVHQHPGGRGKDIWFEL